MRQDNACEASVRNIQYLRGFLMVYVEHTNEGSEANIMDIAKVV